ncbi:biotin-dependent carboxyltransferase family protein [Pararhizobium sp. LjRoot235]|uniref:5-oxoprolinase subunit C family protein n=1 Tax=Pararhizobium sp. LjRoot235 TaxID=3342291 RepID=UPI003ECFE056
MIEILSTGAVNSVQDLGRTGYLNAGVGRSGMMDAPALEVANMLVGNDKGAAGIEVALFPFRLRFDVDTVFAVAGADCPAKLGDRQVPGWWAMNAKAGEVLTLGLPRSGARAVIAFQGGIDVPLVLGSRSTDLKSVFGGFEGRGLHRGDRLALAGTSRKVLRMEGGYGADVSALRGFATENDEAILLRVLPSAEYAAFTDEALSKFHETDWLITNDANRMGYRLSGPELTLTRKLELFSHGIMPGTVQVPPNGQPIIQLTEANTCGGYPKIANVIEADLWKLAQAPVGARLQFEATTRDTAIEALQHQRAFMAELAADAALMRGWN